MNPRHVDHWGALVATSLVALVMLTVGVALVAGALPGALVGWSGWVVLSFAVLAVAVGS